MPVGLDIGYSLVKLAYGNGAAPQKQSIPVGAMPAAQNQSISVNGAALGEGHRVLVNGQEWIAGIEPRGMIQTMDESYPTTDEYRALFLSALDATNLNEIDALITGLPVSQFMDQEFRDRLAKSMVGTHYIRPGREVEVRRASVTPQPAGAYFATRAHLRQQGQSLGEVTLVVDAGHFSLDWVSFIGGKIQTGASHSTARAGEAVISRAAQLLSQEVNREVPKVRLERAIREGRSQVQFGQLQLSFQDAVATAADEVVAENLKAIRGSLRQITQREGVDTLILAGGGAGWFEPALRKAFPTCVLVKAPEPVMANAVGFWHLARQWAVQ